MLGGQVGSCKVLDQKTHVEPPTKTPVVERASSILEDITNAGSDVDGSRSWFGLDGSLGQVGRDTRRSEEDRNERSASHEPDLKLTKARQSAVAPGILKSMDMDERPRRRRTSSASLEWERSSVAYAHHSPLQNPYYCATPTHKRNENALVDTREISESRRSSDQDCSASGAAGLDEDVVSPLRRCDLEGGLLVTQESESVDIGDMIPLETLPGGARGAHRRTRSIVYFRKNSHEASPVSHTKRLKRRKNKYEKWRKGSSSRAQVSRERRSCALPSEDIARAASEHIVLDATQRGSPTRAFHASPDSVHREAEELLLENIRFLAERVRELEQQVGELKAENRNLQATRVAP